jgi:hypothetical protein|tara:strand:- start:249 stop:443 length:195 start_codon:yes stop_codon:yes gene_type:complete
MNKKENPYSIRKIRLEMEEEKLMEFVAGMRKMQQDMIEMLVRSEEHGGFREANEVINRIRKIGK